VGGANLGDLRRDLLRLTARVQLLAAVAFWLFLEIQIGQALTVVIADDETSRRFFDRPRHREVPVIKHPDRQAFTYSAHNPPS